VTREELAELAAGRDRELAWAATVTAELERQNDVDGGLAEELAALRRELRALAVTVEALTLEVVADAGGHSVAVRKALGPEAFLVVNVEADPPELVGTYRRTVQNSVEYRDELGHIRHAPADCVRVLPRSRAEEVVGKGVRS